MAGTCECSNEPFCSNKCGVFFDCLRTGQLLRKDSAPWSKLPIEVIYLLVYHFVFGSVFNGIANRDY